MKSSPARQSLADSASALRCAPANLSAANGSSRRRDLTISRVAAALRQTGFAAAACSSASAALAAAHPMKAQQAAAHAVRAHRNPARQTMASAAMTIKPLLRILGTRTIGTMFALAAECSVNGREARLKPVWTARAKAGGKAAKRQGRAIDAACVLAHEASP